MAEAITKLLEWVVLGWVVGLVLPLGIGFVMGGEPVLARVCFVICAILLCSKIVELNVNTNRGSVSRVVASSILFGVVGLSLVESFRWVNRRNNQQSAKVVESDGLGQTKAAASLTAELLTRSVDKLNAYSGESLH